MPLTVLNVAYPFAPVGADAVGGAEQILTQLDEYLTRIGHQSIVLACEGSTTDGLLLSVPRPGGILSETTIAQTHQLYRQLIQKCTELWSLDLIHLHGVDFHKYLPPTDVPVLVTLHLPPHWYPPEIFQIDRPQTFLHCVSASQRRACPPCSRLLSEIENGVAIDPKDIDPLEGNFVISLGRICPEKGFHMALDAAKRAAIPTVLAGEVFPYETHQTYFRTEIAPRLDSLRRFIGPAGLKKKRELLRSARCLLVPSLVSETSSLVAMEALACGTPVVAFPAGALAEIVEHGKTGFLVRDVIEMAEAIKAAGTLDRQACKQAARERFAQETMLKKYLTLYERIRANVGRPKISPPFDAGFITATVGQHPD